MELQSLQYKKHLGWSLKNFPTDLDSEQTLILIFISQEYSKDFTPIKELMNHFPKSKMISCVNSIKIPISYHADNSITAAILRFEKPDAEYLKSMILATLEQD